MKRSPFIVEGLIALAVSAAPAGCAATYTSRDIRINGQDTVVELRETATAQVELRNNWVRSIARCFVVRRHMQQEIDSLTRQDRITGSAFAIATGLLTIATTVYNAAEDQPNRWVTATLTGLAGATTVPTFWYFGSDRRGEEVRTALAEVDRMRDQAVQLSEQLEALGAAYTTADAARTAANTERDTKRAALIAARQGATTGQEQLVAAVGRREAARTALARTRVGTDARRNAQTTLDAEERAVTDRQRDVERANDAVCTARSEASAADATAGQRQTAFDEAARQTHRAEQELNAHLLRMAVTCR